MNNSLIALFCIVDDFCQIFLPEWQKHLLTTGVKKRNRSGQLTVSEIMTIYIYFHQSHYRDFKNYYINHVLIHFSDDFPKLVSYHRFVALTKSILIPMGIFMQMLTGKKTGLYFIDSTTIDVCNIRREKQNKVFKGIAEKGKSSMGWVFGFKLHLVINDKGEIMAFKLTKSNVDDRTPVLQLTKRLSGKLIGDKGYISQKLSDNLLNNGLQLITKLKKNMKNKLMPVLDKLLLKKRAIIESVNDQLKNISQIEHTRHRSIWNFLANILAGLIAYSLQPKKPSLNLKIELS